MTLWEPLDENERAQYQQMSQNALALDAKDNLPVIEDWPQVVGPKNATKFTPHVA